MNTSDGTVIGTAQILDNGPAANRWNLVIMGELPGQPARAVRY